MSAAIEHVNFTTPSAFTLAIIKEIGKRHGVSVAEIKGPNRKRTIVHARCEAIRAVAAARPHWSYPEIGRHFGNRDHTTIMHHLDKSGSRKPECTCGKPFGSGKRERDVANNSFAGKNNGFETRR